MNLTDTLKGSEMLTIHMRDRLVPASSGVSSGSNDKLTEGELTEEELTAISNKPRTRTSLPVLLNMVLQLLSTEKKKIMYAGETTRASYTVHIQQQL